MGMPVAAEAVQQHEIPIAPQSTFGVTTLLKGRAYIQTHTPPLRHPIHAFSLNRQRDGVATTHEPQDPNPDLSDLRLLGMQLQPL